LAALTILIKRDLGDLEYLANFFQREDLVVTCHALLRLFAANVMRTSYGVADSVLGVEVLRRF
jgi:hypothetical protein